MFESCMGWILQVSYTIARTYTSSFWLQESTFGHWIEFRAIQNENKTNKQTNKKRRQNKQTKNFFDSDDSVYAENEAGKNSAEITARAGRDQLGYQKVKASIPAMTDKKKSPPC